MTNASQVTTKAQITSETENKYLDKKASDKQLCAGRQKATQICKI